MVPFGSAKADGLERASDSLPPPGVPSAQKGAPGKAAETRGRGGERQREAVERPRKCSGSTRKGGERR